ncbi:Hypothetical protein POVR1_LOCUS196 [uncultured virus]|nr:Hypothetical protein POVR1_LOCUS196 [uncultured virus]
MNSSAEIWNAVHSTSSSDSLGSPQIARVNHSPSRRGRPTGQYETFVPLLPFHSSTFDQRMRDLPIDGLVDLYKANQEFQYYLASQERLDYLAERFMLEHCTSFENLMVSYEMRKCLPAGSIYRSEEDQFFWAIYDNNLSAAKVSRIKMKKERRVPNYSMIMKLAIEKGNDETEMLHWLLTDATLHRVSVSYQELLETSITFDRSNTFWHLLAVVNRLGLIIDMGRLLGVAKNHNRKEIVRVMANHC